MIKILFFFFILIYSSLTAQTISNVKVRQEGLEIVITYDMVGKLNENEEIFLEVSTNNGFNYKPVTTAYGDIGKNITPGNRKEINFLPRDDLTGFNAKFKIYVSMKPPPGMVYVKGGTFKMGGEKDSDEKPIHTVTVRSFFMDKTEVTQAQYRKVMGKNPSRFDGCDDCPVENVSWHDAVAYAQKVGKRLPTEAEWEYAARGGQNSKGYKFSGSDDLNRVGWYRRNSNKKTHPVGQKKPNELGLYDMSGNVWEWCSDWYSGDYYRQSPKNDPMGPNSGSSRVLRGGGWLYRLETNCRVANRYGYDPDDGYSDTFGFRLVRSAQ